MSSSAHPFRNELATALERAERLARENAARKDVMEWITHGPRGDIVDLYTTPPWELLCTEISKLRISQRRGKILAFPKRAAAGETNEASYSNTNASTPLKKAGGADGTRNRKIECQDMLPRDLSTENAHDPSEPSALSCGLATDDYNYCSKHRGGRWADRGSSRRNGSRLESRARPRSAPQALHRLLDDLEA
jgi:hypothetical protein